MLAAIQRIVNAEAVAAGAPKPPEITPLDRYSSVTNDADATEKVVEAFRQNFPDGSVEQTKPTMASEDFGCFWSGVARPSGVLVLWGRRS